MFWISRRILAGSLLLVLLPLAALARDKDASAPTTTPAPPEAAAAPAPSAPTPASGLNPTTDPLLQLLVSKGILSAKEVNGLAVSPTGPMRNQLLQLLKAKGVLSAEDLKALESPVTAATPTSSSPAETLVEPTATATSDVPQGGGAPSVVPAIAPLRVLSVDPPKREGLIPDISIGKNIHVKPYGFVKVSGVYDSSSPYGNDFPLPGFNPITNGPDNLAEFHVKARATRFGASFEWLDIAPNVVLTGKIEADFEGNFSRANNRNISTVRSNMPSLRLAYARVDWHSTDTTTLHFLAGQDWTPFGSSTLPNLFETTGFGIGFGTLYERAPQIRFGLNHQFGGSRSFSLEPEVAMVLPAFGTLPADLTVQTGPLVGTPIPNNSGIANQLGYGERQGADSGRPEVEARLVAQFQLDKAPGVAPAQIIVSGVNAERDVVVLANQVPATFSGAFPTGVRISNDRNAWTGEIQLPTRWFTLIGKYYNGSDLRFFFAGQIFGEFNDTTGLINTATAQSIDGASTVVFGCRGGTGAACTGGTLVVANQLAARAQGGFINLGLPLSRWANANPAGRNAGWALYLHYGYDQVLARDVRRLGGGRHKGDLFAPSLQYKMNSFLTFVVEESLYRTRAIPLTATGLLPSFAGRPMREWKDFRSEFGPIFSF
jgi:hypothetical protein